MSKTSNGETSDGAQARMIVGYAVESASFRESIIGKSAEEIHTVVVANAESIGVEPSSVANNVYQAIAKLTSDDMSALIRIYDRVKDHGIGERSML
jgi:hypothetical protein